MPTKRRMDRKDVGYIYNGILSSHVSNEILPFVTTWMEEGIMVQLRIQETNGGCQREGGGQGGRGIGEETKRSKCPAAK